MIQWLLFRKWSETTVFIIFLITWVHKLGQSGSKVNHTWTRIHQVPWVLNFSYHCRKPLLWLPFWPLKGHNWSNVTQKQIKSEQPPPPPPPQQVCTPSLKFKVNWVGRKPRRTDGRTGGGTGERSPFLCPHFIGWDKNGEINIRAHEKTSGHIL